MHFSYIIFALKIKCSNLKPVQQRVFKRRFDYESRLSTMFAVQYFTTCYQLIERESEPSNNDQKLGSILNIYILLTDFRAQNLGPIRSNVNVMSKSQRCVKYGEASIKVNANNYKSSSFFCF